SYLFHCLCDLRSLHSFPTRRSSDLFLWSRHNQRIHPAREWTGSLLPPWKYLSLNRQRRGCVERRGLRPDRPRLSHGRAVPPASRSEEHTSELQSRFDLVCRLLLEKK